MNTVRAWVRRHWPVLWLLFALLLSMLLQWPMALLVKSQARALPAGVAVAEVRGSLWSAQARGLRLGALRRDHVELHMPPASLLRGRPQLLTRPDFATLAAEALSPGNPEAATPGASD
ncbi:hypothetical protein [Luteimonas sp. e5]